MRKSLALALFALLILSGISYAWEGTGTVLQEETLPEKWTLGMEYLASPNEVQMFSTQLGANIRLLRNYVLDTPDGRLQVNVLLTETEEEAAALYQLFLSMHAKDEVVVNGRRLLEAVTDNPGLVKTAQDSIKFVSEETSREADSVLRDYVEANSWRITDLAEINYHLKPELDRYSVFLVGESHGVSINQKLESSLLEFFVIEGGVRNYLLELSPSVAGYLRQYVETGNEEILLKVFEAVKGTYFWTKENLQHWRNVRALWQSLPEDQKFSLIGIDVEHQFVLSLQYIDSLLSDVDQTALAETELAKIGAVLRGELQVPNSALQAFAQDLLEDLESEKTASLLGTLYTEVELVLSNFAAGIELQFVQDETQWNGFRDQMMFENFRKQSDPDGEAKYFGQWGLNHVFQMGQRGINWAASAIDGSDETPYQDKVLSIALLYYSSQALQNVSYTIQSFDNYLTSHNLLGEIADGGVLLAKLDGEGSPFSEQMIWKVRDIKPITGVTTDAFQYILFISGEEPSSPLGP